MAKVAFSQDRTFKEHHSVPGLRAEIAKRLADLSATGLSGKITIEGIHATGTRKDTYHITVSPVEKGNVPDENAPVCYMVTGRLEDGHRADAKPFQFIISRQGLEIAPDAESQPWAQSSRTLWVQVLGFYLFAVPCQWGGPPDRLALAEWREGQTTWMSPTLQTFVVPAKIEISSGRAAYKSIEGPLKDDSGDEGTDELLKKWKRDAADSEFVFSLEAEYPLDGSLPKVMKLRRRNDLSLQGEIHYQRFEITVEREEPR